MIEDVLKKLDKEIELYRPKKILITEELLEEVLMFSEDFKITNMGMKYKNIELKKDLISGHYKFEE